MMRKYSLIGNTSNFDESNAKKDVVAFNHIHRYLSDMQVVPIFLRKEEVDVLLQKWVEIYDRENESINSKSNLLRVVKNLNNRQFLEFTVIIATNMFRKPPIDLSNQNPFVSFIELMKHYSNVEKSRNGNWVIWDNPIYSGSPNLEEI